jgi:small conductance mechanosensitive channel
LFSINQGTYLADIVEIGVMITLSILWIFVAIITNRIIRKSIFRLLRVKDDEPRLLTLAKLLTSIFRYIIWFIVLMIILDIFGVDLSPFIASAGVGGLALAFGAQELVKDFISGAFIIFEDEFKVGDLIEVDDFTGTVKSIGLRTTIIENWKGQQKIINNGQIRSIINHSKSNSVAIIDFGVSYDTKMDNLYQLIDNFIDIINEKYHDIIERPQFLGVTELADSSINLRIMAKTKTLSHFQIERDIRRDLVDFFREHDIEIPFPQVVIHNA